MVHCVLHVFIILYAFCVCFLMVLHSLTLQSVYSILWSDIASFGVQTLPRILLLVPDRTAASEAVLSLLSPSIRGLGIVAFAALTTALQPITWTGRLDVQVPINGAFTAILFIAAYTSSSRRHYVGIKSNTCEKSLKLVAVLYSFLLVPLGLMEVGNSSPFSSLRKHGM